MCAVVDGVHPTGGWESQHASCQWTATALGAANYCVLEVPSPRTGTLSRQERESGTVYAGAHAMRPSRALNTVRAAYCIAAHCACRQGIEGHGFYGKCVIPVIENTARECELTDRLRQAIADYPQANAVLVRRHGEVGGQGGR